MKLIEIKTCSIDEVELPSKGKTFQINDAGKRIINADAIQQILPHNEKGLTGLSMIWLASGGALVKGTPQEVMKIISDLIWT